LFDGVDLEIDHHKHKPNQVAKCCFKKLMICMIQKNSDQLIILNEEVKSFTDICGACERIKHHSPILTALSLKIHFFLCDDIAFWIFFQFGLLCSSGFIFYVY
jgi:putative membrane protein